MDANSARVVYIEDDSEMIELVTLIIERHGYRLIGAQGGQEGLDIILKSPPELILLDLMMPDMDGWDVYHQIKANASTNNIPVIVISAKSLDIDRVLGLHIAKVDDYISKPFRPQELLYSIDKVMRAKSTEKNHS
jgi:DNA-binding response OmpR family regulator